MVDDDLFTRVPRPDVVLGQHVAPIPAGTIGLRSGPAFAASDSIRVTLHGTGGHGSRPEATVDPVVMAAATVMRLQTLVSREVAGTDTAVRHRGCPQRRHEGEHHPRRRRAAPQRPQLRRGGARPPARGHRPGGARRGRGLPGATTTRHQVFESAPAVVNEPDAVERTRGALESVVGAGRVVDPGPVTGSEDVGVLATAAGAPLVYWLLGGADPAPFAGAATPEQLMRVVAGLPSNHSPQFAPVEDPTLRIGVEALVAAATEWLST